MTPITPIFNRDMLRIARDSRGLSQKDVSQQSGIPVDRVSKIQRGLLVPDAEVIDHLADALGYPSSLFYLPQSRIGLGVSVNFFRKRASSLKKHLGRLEAMAVFCRIWADGLMREAEVNFPADLDRFPIEEFPGGDPAEVAALVRASWHLPAGPVENLVRTVERAGVIVFKFSFETRLIDGMSQWIDGGLPLLFINSDAPADRVRFSLAHELAHLVMHERPTETMESEADAFASAFLMPRQEIRRDLFNLTLERAASLKGKWRVSMGAIVRRARDLGCITPDRYQDLCILMSKRGYRRVEPYPIADETPSTIGRVVQAFVERTGMTWQEIGGMTHLLPGEAQETLGQDRGLYMRLVS